MDTHHSQCSSPSNVHSVNPHFWSATKRGSIDLMSAFLVRTGIPSKIKSGQVNQYPEGFRILPLPLCHETENTEPR
jgi:hypothetical protein